MNECNQIKSVLDSSELNRTAIGIPKKETPLTRLSGAIDRLRKAGAQVCDLSIKLVGSGPCEDECGASTPVEYSIFGSIEEMADEVSRLASDIASHIERVERRL